MTAVTRGILAMSASVVACRNSLVRRFKNSCDSTSRSAAARATFDSSGYISLAASAASVGNKPAYNSFYEWRNFGWRTVVSAGQSWRESGVSS